MKKVFSSFSRKMLSLMLCLLVVTGALPLGTSVVHAAETDLFTSVGVSTYGTTYYVDAENGNDDNSGKSPKDAWQSLTKVSATTFKAGDHILLRASSVWNGQMLYPKGSGDTGASIVLDLYEMDGDKAIYSANTRPIINGNGTSGIGTKKALVSGTVMLYNQEYWQIQNLEITNSENLSDANAYKKQGTAQRCGILVYTDIQERLLNHVVIKNNYVHDVQTEYYQKPNDSSIGGLKAVGGIIVLGHHLNPDGELVATEKGKSRAAYDDVLIEGNVVRRVGLEGIRTKCNSNTSLSGNTFFKMFTNVIIRNNYLEDIAGDGIVLTEVKNGGIVENNISKQACNADYGTHNYAGIWSMYADNALFQYNEVYGIVYGYNDGEAFDIDMSCDNNLYQYNYSHHNSGGFFLFMGDQTNSTVRYNISANDGGGSKGTGADGGAGNKYTYAEQSIFHYWNKTDNATMPTIYNNTFYVGDGVSTSLFGEGNGSDNSGTIARFYNNILYKEGAGSLKFLSNYPTSGATPTERKLGTNPQNFIKNNIIWPESIASETSGATSAILKTSGNIFESPKLVIQSDATKLSELASQNNTTFDVKTQNIYDFTSTDRLRERSSMFKLQADSPAYGAGMIVTDAPSEDIFGNKVEGYLPDIGAHQASQTEHKTEIESISTYTGTTLAGIYPSLPNTVTVTFKDTSGAAITTRTEDMPVLWDLIPADKYTAAGTFTVSGSVAGLAQKTTATITVSGSTATTKYEKTFAATDAAFMQRNNGDTAYGATAGASSVTSTGELYKTPLARSYSNNYVLKIKNAAAASYNRRFIIKFDVNDFSGDWAAMKNASIRLHVARYDAWKNMGTDTASQLNNTAFMLDVYATEPTWTGSAVTWNNAPLNDEVSANNHVGTSIPTYSITKPFAHKMYANKDIIANDNTIDIDVSDYIRSLEPTQKEVSFLVDIPTSSVAGYNSDNSGFDAFSTLGAAQAFADYKAGLLGKGIVVESKDSLAPQLVVSNVYEKNISEITIDTLLGAEPILPSTATLTYSDGTTRALGVTWDSIPAENYAKEGTFTVRGTSSATNMPIVATITVTAEHIASFEALETIETTVGYARNELGLAAKATAVLESGKKIEVAVSRWDDSAPPYSPQNAPYLTGYDFTGIFELPAGVSNPNDQKPSQKVITHAKPLSVTIDMPEQTIAIGESKQFTAIVLCNPDVTDSWSQKVQWDIASTSDALTGVNIDANGLLTTTSDATAGSYTITATSKVDSTLQSTSKLIIQADASPSVTAVAVSPSTVNVEIGATQQFTASVTAQAGASEAVTWSVSGNLSPTTTIDASGLLSIAADETATTVAVTATSQFDNTVKNTATVTITTQTAPAVTEVKITPPISIQLTAGDAVQLSATASAVGGANNGILWTIKNATSTFTVIDASGMLTIGDDEIATSIDIYATSKFDSTKQDKITFTISPDTTPKISQMSITPQNSSVHAGDTAQFSATVTAHNGADESVTWSLTETPTSAQTILDSNGLLTIGEDETVQTFTVVATSVFDTQKQASSTVTVLDKDTPSVLLVVISGDKTEVVKGETVTHSATITADDGADKSLLWEVSGATSVNTTISPEGVLSVASDENATELVVTATSVANSHARATNTIKVISPALTISKIASIQDISVAAGTAQADLNLPASVSADLSDGSTQAIAITKWTSTPAYEKDKAGDYVFAAEFDYSSVTGLTNPLSLVATAKITVKSAPSSSGGTSSSSSSSKASSTPSSTSASASASASTNTASSTKTASTSNSKTSPKTGDSTNLTVWLSVGGVTVIALASIFVYLRKRKSSRK